MADTEVLKAYNIGITNGTSSTTFDPDTLMMKTNPLLNSTKTIEQIQMYYLGIQNELNKYQIQEQKK